MDHSLQLLLAAAGEVGLLAVLLQALFGTSIARCYVTAELHTLAMDQPKLTGLAGKICSSAQSSTGLSKVDGAHLTCASLLGVSTFWVPLQVAAAGQ